MTQFSHALPRSASCSLMHDCGQTTERIKVLKVLLGPCMYFVYRSASWLVLPEGLYYIGGWCGSSIKIRFPGEGDGGAGNVSDLRFGRGTGDQVWVSGSVWLDWNSKLLMKNRKKERNKKDCSLLLFPSKGMQNFANTPNYISNLTCSFPK